METKAHQINREEQKRLLAFLNKKVVNSHCNYFSNIAKLRPLIGGFYDGVVQNYVNLSNTEKKIYLDGLIIQISSLSFSYNAEFIDAQLRIYGEEVTSFPNFEDKILREKLSRNFNRMSPAEIGQQTISEVVACKELQKEFLQFVIDRKVQEILGFLERSIAQQEGELDIPDPAHTFQAKPRLKKTAKRKLLSLLQKELNYSAFIENGEGIVEWGEQAEKIIKETKILKMDMLEEVRENLLLQLKLPEMCRQYLEWLQADFEKLMQQFEKIEFHYLNTQEELPEPLLQECADRPEIVEGVRYLNSKRLEMTRNLLISIEEKLSKYTAQGQNLRENALTSNQIVLLLLKLGFFKMPLLEMATHVALARILALITGRNEKNLKTHIEKFVSLKSSNFPDRHKKDDALAEKLKNEILGKKG